MSQFTTTNGGVSTTPTITDLLLIARGHISQSEVAKGMGVSESTFSRSLSKWALGYLLELQDGILEAPPLPPVVVYKKIDEPSEALIEKLIHEKSQSESGISILNQRGLPVVKPLLRQFAMGDFGQLDLFCMDEDSSGNVNFNVYELKVEKTGFEIFEQIAKYITGIRLFAEKSGCIDRCKIKIYVVAPKFSNKFVLKSMIDSMQSNFIQVEFLEFTFDLTGVSFSKASFENDTSGVNFGKLTSLID